MPSYSIYEDLNDGASNVATLDPSSCVHHMDCNVDDEPVHPESYRHFHQKTILYGSSSRFSSSSASGNNKMMPTNISVSSKSHHLLNTSHTKQEATFGFIDLNVHSSLLSFGDNKENIDPMTGRVYPVLQPLHSVKSKSSNNPHLQRNPLKDITQQVLGVNRKQSNNALSTPTSSEKNSTNRKLSGARSSGNPLSPSALYLR
ncbi:hypothetical protein C9374_001571 [Naegleria lovaniensis]|uniref:Uncharacterized protein n=1 Tax=Naegleria lovaniensis TaxID=51637 RepID=A0AA88GW50_NAELO|nr:uncharacterized protein C9374_001571 [Naegleria lovaniensis]KAG2387239.1 hypothetical protein C9374_001571 [Naegleria lovaniensis]